MSLSPERSKTHAAFVGPRLLLQGPLDEVLRAAKEAQDGGNAEDLLVFDEDSGRQVDFDLRGSLKEVLLRALPPKPEAGPGRPKLGVTCREVCLLPRHWEWLDQQPQGASAALRRLVDEARKREPNKAQARRIREATGRIMGAMAGDRPNFEEALRALYVPDLARFKAQVAGWPKDIRAYLVERLKEAAEREDGA